MATKPVKIVLTKLLAMLNGMEKNCLALSAQAGLFKDDTLDHSINIISGIIHSMRRRVMENESRYISNPKKGD